MALPQTIETPDAPTADMARSSSFPSAFARLMVRSEPGFSSVERTVIELARRDPFASLEPPGPIERAIAWIFGKRIGSRRLADPKLEALRRAVVVTQQRRHLPDPVAADLRAWGYGEQRIRMVETITLGT